MLNHVRFALRPLGDQELGTVKSIKGQQQRTLRKSATEPERFAILGQRLL
jgi:hypothetical protein